jgi:membrane-associated phospholipid phosphatase
MPYWKRFAFATLVGAGSLFAILAANVAGGDPLALVDARVAAWFAVNARPALTTFMLIVTHAHAPAAILLYAAAAGTVFARRREWYWFWGLVIAVPGGLLINVVLKHVFQRARPTPEHPLLLLATYSFPSGHTAGATLLYGVLAAYTSYKSRHLSTRLACIASWLVLVVLVGSSRIYLGVHFTSDVVGAVAWSLAWLALCLIAAHALHARMGRR